MQNSNANVPEAMFLAAYVGSSMEPTLREPEIMEVMPYGNRMIRVGDVAFFLSPEADQPVVHRIVRVTPEGISTLGDNNTREDALLLQPNWIKGRVVAAWRGQKRRKIAGRLQGRLTGRWLRWRGSLDRGLSPHLHPLYQALSTRQWITRLLPAPFRPRVVVFHIQGRDQLQLLLGQRIIGRFDDQGHKWQIQRPFRLLVNERGLPGQAKKDRSNRQVLVERQPNLIHPVVREVRYELILADGTYWEIAARDEEAASIVSQLGCALRLHMARGAIDASHHNHSNRLLVQVNAHSFVADWDLRSASENEGDVVCTLAPGDHSDGPYVNLVRLSLIIARQAQSHGGALIHGALAERDGMGVILAAPGGTGKTTASDRLPAPWRSLCDDTTLVVQDQEGNYWAHPWPTWSRFLDGGPGGTWDVQNAVPVRGIFFLVQAAEDRVERVGQGQAVSLLGESISQVSMFMAPGLCKEELRMLHLEGFNNLCNLVRVLPVYSLHLSLTGTFWHEIEKVL